MELVVGTFKHTASQKEADFWTKCGVEPSLAKKLVGTHWTLQMKCIEDNRMFIRMEVEELPELNYMSFCGEDATNEMDLPEFGKVKFTYKNAKAGVLESDVEYEKYGNFTMLETFSAEGFVSELTSKASGESLKENWTRVVDLDGTYRLVKTKDIENFESLFEGYTKEMLLNPESKFKMQELSDGSIKCTDYFNGQEIKTVAKLDEESTYDFDRNVSNLMVKVGPGHYKTISKHQDGRAQEITSKHSGNQIIMDFKDLRSGKTYQLVYEKFADFSGSYKVISSTGIKDFMKAFGVSNDILDKFYVDQNAITIVAKETGNALTHAVMMNGTVVDENCCYLGGEEFKMKPASMNGLECTGVAVKKGNCVDIVCKTAGMTLKSQMKLTKNFLVKTDEIAGTGVMMTQIMMKID